MTEHLQSPESPEQPDAWEPDASGRKPTREEHDERIELTRDLLASGKYKHQVKKALQQRYGVTVRTCENYIARARDLMLKSTGRPAVEHTAESLAFYESILSDSKASIRDKLKARELADKLLGLQKPQRVSMTDPSGEKEARGVVILMPHNNRDPVPETVASRMNGTADLGLDQIDDHESAGDSNGFHSENGHDSGGSQMDEDG